MNIPSTLDRFREVWVCDTEYGSVPGNPVRPVCLVAKELRTGQVVSLWQGDLSRFSALPFGGDDTLFVSFQAAAECSFLLALGWKLPHYVLCLYAEHQSQFSGMGGEKKLVWSLLEAMANHGLEVRDAEHKSAMVKLIIENTVYTAEQKTSILDYCLEDVNDEVKLFFHTVGHAEFELSQALLRGEFMACVARMEHRGFPIDVAMFSEIKNNLGRLATEVVSKVDRDYGVYKGLSINRPLFEQWLAKKGFEWPRLVSGMVSIDKDTIEKMGDVYPEVKALHQSQVSLSLLKKFPLQVGDDGRCRCWPNPFGSKTGRSQPSGNRQPFGLSKWVRSLIKPIEGKFFAYVDFAQEEFAVAAYLSSDANMIACYESGDPYIFWAKLTGAVPADATKASHPGIRARYKTAILALQYGGGLSMLAARMGVSKGEAQILLNEHHSTFSTFWDWSRKIGDVAVAKGGWETILGWHHHLTYPVTSTQLANFPIQSNSAEILRVSTIIAFRRSVPVIWTVHDALAVEGPVEDAEKIVGITEEAMQEASSLVLRLGKSVGPRLRVESSIVKFPERYMDDEGKEAWEWISVLLSDVKKDP